MADGVATQAEREPPGPTVLAPVAAGDRFEALDVLRGFAVLGILAMNIMVFAMPFSAYQNPAAYPAFSYEGLNRVSYWVTHTIFDTKMMTIFSMLFGAGLIVYARKAEDAGRAGRVAFLWFRRMFWLLLIGLVHAFFIWEGDILVTYAVCGLIALWWLRRLRGGWLVALSVVFFLISELGFLAFSAWAWMSLTEEGHRFMSESWRMSPEEIEQATSETAKMFAPTPEYIAELERTYRGGYSDIFAHRAKQVPGMLLFFLPLFLFWRSVAAMLLGAALTKWGVLTGERSGRFYAKLAVVGYLLGFGMIVPGVVLNEGHGFDPAKTALWGLQFNLIGSIPMALGHVGFVVWLLKSGLLGFFGRALGAAGRMALTNYLMQSVLAGLFFYGYGLAYYGKLDRFEQQGVVVVIWALELAWSVWWLKRFRFGPAEWLWRSLTYMKAQPMRKMP